ncbi:MAG: tetratricopeptide repeat protein [Prolixibacteraceae bacterium]|nr:tetratricopeptide repeat protein [Prolixibacteraceae bacterium]
MSRRYHNLTAHYNVYFNGRESLRAGAVKINNSYEDDFSKVLPLFKSSNPSTATAATADMENAVAKGSKLIQSHSITKRLKRRKTQNKAYLRFAKREEFNNWVDDAYILMGKAYFYQHNFGSAIENFSYVTRKFEDDPSRYTAYVWLIKCYTELERYVEAFEVIQQMQDDEDFPRQLEGELAAVTADYYARQLSYAEGIPFLSIAVKQTAKKQDKLRYKYVLAQWYQETENPEKASQTFRELSRMNPPYKMAFNARINAAGTFTGDGNVENLKKELQKMLRDKKNLEFRDQIYFAMGNISMKEGNKDQAKREYTKSASLSSTNLYQRALSCLTLAQIYFEELEYKKSQSYYDSAMIVIDDKYPNFTQISERYKSLTRLTDNIYAVEREDSLQRIALMDEPSRNALIDQWIRDVQEKEAQAKQAENAQMMDRNYFRQYESRFGLSQQQEGAGWYFYSPTTVAYGKVEFERLWGKRKLEDGWRRSDKRSGADMEGEAEEDSLLVSEGKEKKISDPKVREYYTQDLPVNDSLMAVSHTKIRNALFNAGRIFKTEFTDYPRSIESFEDLNKRYPENLFALSSWFELWDLYTKQNDQEKADYYKNLIVGKYPDSKYAKYLLNPNYFVELEARNDSINKLYQQVFLDFKNGQYVQSGKIADQVMMMQPDSTLISKIKFFKVIADGTASSRENLGKLLTEYIKTYPKAEPKPLAERILKLIQDSTLVDYQQLVASGYLSDQIKNSELLPGNQKGADEFGGKFSYDEDLLHYFVIAYPKNANVDLNRLKFDLANYNIDHYTKIDFDIETVSLNNTTSMLVVRSLNDKEQGLIYFRSVIKRRTVFEALKNVKYVNFMASSTNYRQITADKDFAEYLKFFVKNYSRFITGDFSDEILPEPEELIAKAKQEEEALKEKGSFVTVAPTGSGLDIYSKEDVGAQNFVIAVNSPGANMKPVVAGFNTHNREQYRQLDLAIRQTNVADYQLMIVSSFKTKTEALDYFTKAITNRKLYKSLDTLSYRNFIITDANLRKLSETRRIGEYLNFFKAKYTDTSAATSQSVTEYNGPYKTPVDGKQSFVLIIPKEEVNAESLAEAIRQFNQQSYSQLKLLATTSMLDDFRVVLKVEGLPDQATGLAYLRAIANEPKVYGPIQHVNYRNFVITPENEAIFRQSKNILIYMDFYKQFYLK